jgi:hypothetical protein
MRIQPSVRLRCGLCGFVATAMVQDRALVAMSDHVLAVHAEAAERVAEGAGGARRRRRESPEVDGTARGLKSSRCVGLPKCCPLGGHIATGRARSRDPEDGHGPPRRGPL